MGQESISSHLDTQWPPIRSTCFLSLVPSDALSIQQPRWTLWSSFTTSILDPYPLLPYTPKPSYTLCFNGFSFHRRWNKNSFIWPIRLFYGLSTLHPLLTPHVPKFYSKPGHFSFIFLSLQCSHMRFPLPGPLFPLLFTQLTSKHPPNDSIIRSSGKPSCTPWQGQSLKL